MNLEKHPLNILPEMSEDEKNELRENLIKNGFDKDFPIFTYEGKVLDGWNRYLLCLELGIEPVFKAKDEEFAGNPEKAVDFILQVNTRRNLNSSQKAALAVECEELIERIKADTEKTRREKQGNTQKEKKGKTITDGAGETEAEAGDDRSGKENDSAEDESSESGSTGERADGEAESDGDEHKNKTSTKLAEKFDTNRTYVNDAAKLKQEAPEEFEKVKSGEKSISQAKKDIASKKRTYFEEIAAHFAEYPKVLKKLQEYASEELVLNLQQLYAQILNIDIQEFEKLNAEIATYTLCEDCGGAGCGKCDKRGFFKPVEETDA